MINVLNLPFLYNLRFLIAGDQKLTRQFVAENYQVYNCRSVLDIGCGTGDFAPLFPKEEYLGIDTNPAYISFAKNKYLHQFFVGNILNYNFGKQFFDASILISFLHHLSDQQVKRILPKIISLTRKIIIIVDLNPQTSFLKKLAIRLDRGNFVRTTEKKIVLLSHFAKIVKISHFSTGLASQTGLVFLPKK